MKKILVYTLLAIMFLGCKKELDELEKYQAPDWLKGKLYTQVEAQEELTVFAEALRLVGMDTIINTSGLFTVFAPTDEAFDLYFQEHPEYNNRLENMALPDLRKLVNFHIVQNSWSKEQLSSLNLGGWIGKDDEEVTQRAYKKETLYRSENTTYQVLQKDEEEYVITTHGSGQEKTVYTRSRKYAPVFFREYFETYDIPPSDYDFYFDRSYSGGFYYAGGRVINENEIPAENGYLYLVDRVVEPMPSVEEILQHQEDGNTYEAFLSLVYEFPQFTANLDATYEQAGAGEGQAVDTLYNLSFPELEFNIHSEMTDPNQARALASIQYHNALFAPTDEAFEQFLNQYVYGPDQWGGLEDMPRAIKSIIVNSYMVPDIIYKSDIDEGFENAERDRVRINSSDILQKTFGSNATFIGLQKPIVPRAFSSVTAPVYLRRGYFTYLTAIEETNILDALKKEDESYTFFVIPDLGSGIMRDSSLILSEKRNKIVFSGFDYSLEEEVNIPANDLRKKILNHVGTSLPEGVADLEFIKNLAGNYLVFDNVTGEVRGSAPTSYGLNGDSLISLEPVLLEEATDNGQTYRIDTWFSFSRSPMDAQILSINPGFLNLLEEAGLAERLIGEEFDLSFLNPGASYTVFIPSVAALDAYDTDTLSSTELAAFLRNHYLPNALVFTDGKSSSGDYPTLNAGTDHALHLETGPDFISLRDRSGAEMVRIGPEDGKSNLMATSNVGNDNSTSEWNFITTGVVHEIDTVLVSDNIY